MICCNQSPLEVPFSILWGSNHDDVYNLGGEITNECIQQVNTIQVTCHLSLWDNQIEESDTFVVLLYSIVIKKRWIYYGWSNEAMKIKANICIIQ